MPAKGIITRNPSGSIYHSEPFGVPVCSNLIEYGLSQKLSITKVNAQNARISSRYKKMSVLFFLICLTIS